MYLSNSMSMVKYPMNTDYFVWLITFFVLTTFFLIVLVVVILICSSYRRKQKLLLNGSSYNGDRDIFVIDNGQSTDNKIICASVVNCNGTKPALNVANNCGKKRDFMCCLHSRTDSSINVNDNEEGFVLIDSDGQIMNIEIRDKDLEDENLIHLSGTLSNGKNEYENCRLSHIDRELPPLPFLLAKLESESGESDSLIKDSMLLSMTGSLKYSDLDKQAHKDSTCNNTSCDDDSTLSRHGAASIKRSPELNKNELSNTDITSTVCCCCCSNNVHMPSADDLSSTDYDPTYAAIRRIKVTCPICGAPSVYTPVNSNRNSNLSLQLNSCLGSPVRCPINGILNYDSLNNSTYASIAKLSKNCDHINGDQEIKSGFPTIKRQRSISQGDIITGTLIKNNKMQQSEIVCDSSKIDDCDDSVDHVQQKKDISFVGNKPPLNYISLWSLMASNRNSPFNMFPIIPERAYGQSVVDLVERLRSSDKSDTYNFVHSATETNIERCYTQPMLFGNSFKRRGSLTNFKGQVWSPQSCQMIHRSSVSKFGLCSPLKILDQESKYSGYDLEFPVLGRISFSPIQKYFTGSGKRNFLSFQPILTPPLSPMDYNDGEKEVKLNKLELDESKYENPSFFYSENGDDDIIKHVTSVYEDLDSEAATVNKDALVTNERETDHYEYLPDSVQLCQTDFDLIDTEKLLSFSNNTEILPTKARPISIVLYNDDMSLRDKCFNYRFDNLDVYGVSSVQMSPLMEQSLENSSSKTTLSSLSFQHFNRLLSSEDSCAKSPPSAGASPSLDKLEISPDGQNFLFNDFLWSNFNSAFDDYETFE